MATPILYDLDQEQYSTGRNTGRFNAVRQTAQQQPGMDALTAFLASLKVPVKPDITAPAVPVIPETLPAKPVAPSINMPTVSPIDPGVLARTQGFKGYESTAGAELRAYMNGPASGNTGKNDYDWHRDMLDRTYGFNTVQGWDQDKRNAAALNANSIANAYASQSRTAGFWAPVVQRQSAYGTEKSTVAGYKPLFDQYNADVTAYQSAKTAAQPQIDAYTAAGAEYNKQMEPIKAEVDRYNTQLGEYKSIADAYNKEVSGYMTSREGAVNQFMADRQSMDVTGKQQQSRGQQLASTSTYADDLHQQMLDRIGEVNLEAQSQASASSKSSIYSQA